MTQVLDVQCDVFLFFTFLLFALVLLELCWFEVIGCYLSCYLCLPLEVARVLLKEVAAALFHVMHDSEKVLCRSVS